MITVFYYEVQVTSNRTVVWRFSCLPPPNRKISYFPRKTIGTGAIQPNCSFPKKNIKFSRPNITLHFYLNHRIGSRTKYKISIPLVDAISYYNTTNKVTTRGKSTHSHRSRLSKEKSTTRITLWVRNDEDCVRGCFPPMSLNHTASTF